MPKFFGYEKFLLSFLLLPSVAAPNLSTGVFNLKKKNKKLWDFSPEKEEQGHIYVLSFFLPFVFPHTHLGQKG